MNILEFPNLCAKNCFLRIPHITKQEIDYWNNNPTVFEFNHYFLIFFEIDETAKIPYVSVNVLNRNMNNIDGINFNLKNIKYEFIITLPENFHCRRFYEVKHKIPRSNDYWEIYVGHIPFFTKGKSNFNIEPRDYEIDEYYYFTSHLNNLIQSNYEEFEHIPYTYMYSVWIQDKLETNRLILNRNRIIYKLESEESYEDFKDHISFPISSEEDVTNWNRNPFVCEENKFVVFVEFGDEPDIRINHRQTLSIDIPDEITTEIILVIPEATSEFKPGQRTWSGKRFIIPADFIPFFCENVIDHNNDLFFTNDNAELYSWMFEQHMYCLKNKVKPIDINEFIKKNSN